MNEEQQRLQWLALIVSSAPCQTIEQLRFKAYWLSELADQLEPESD